MISSTKIVNLMLVLLFFGHKYKSERRECSDKTTSSWCVRVCMVFFGSSLPGKWWAEWLLIWEFLWQYSRWHLRVDQRPCASPSASWEEPLVFSPWRWWSQLNPDSPRPTSHCCDDFCYPHPLLTLTTEFIHYKSNTWPSDEHVWRVFH